jgi:hypothetical protein
MIELLLGPDFDARDEWEAEQRGLLDNVRVRLNNGEVYTVQFFTPERLAFETKTNLEYSMHDGYNGLVLVKIVTRAAMQQAVEALADTDFFWQLKPEG